MFNFKPVQILLFLGLIGSLIFLYSFSGNPILSSESNFVKDAENSIWNSGIKCILTNRDSVLFKVGSERSNPDYVLIFDSKVHTVKFIFLQHFIDNKPAIEYKIRLDGLEDDFSEWAFLTYRTFYHLSPGKYTLIINAKNPGEIKPEEYYFQFQISKPSFLSLLSILIYCLGVVLLFVIIIQWHRYRIAIKNFEKACIVDQKNQELIKVSTEYEKLMRQQNDEFAETLKKKKEKTSKRFKMVTVLFSDILGFTKLTQQQNREQLIDDLDKFFFTFDQVVKKFNIQKIKTVGDIYICAGGIPEKNRTNPIEVVLAAFEMQKYMNTLKQKYINQGSGIWELRLGIHTGPVFAAIEPKRQIEIWGDTVNIASRMESSGDIDKVNISGMTYELVREFFVCQYRGKMPAKYQGEVDMYYIEGFRPRLSVIGKGIEPNKSFWVKLGMIRFDDLEETIMNHMETKLPEHLYYHNLKHTIDVIVQVEIIGRQEDITEEELWLLKTAALLHDTGFMLGYHKHEELGVKYASEVLPKWNYTEEQIKLINELILVTKLPPRPKNLLEAIICDADLDYLGRADFIPVSTNLFRELVEHKIIDNDLDAWNQMQIEFIENHSYFTDSAKRLRDVNKLKQLESIRNMVIKK